MKLKDLPYGSHFIIKEKTFDGVRRFPNSVFLKINEGKAFTPQLTDGKIEGYTYSLPAISFYMSYITGELMCGYNMFEESQEVIPVGVSYQIKSMDDKRIYFDGISSDRELQVLTLFGKTFYIAYADEDDTVIIDSETYENYEKYSFDSAANGFFFRKKINNSLYPLTVVGKITKIQVEKELE